MTPFLKKVFLLDVKVFVVQFREVFGLLLSLYTYIYIYIYIYEKLFFYVSIRISFFDPVASES